MKNKAWLWLTFLGLVVAGCIVPSVYPFYTDKDLEYDPALTGDWQKTGANVDTNEVWSFTKSGEKEYEMLTKESDKTNTLTAHLFRLNNQLYMDWMVHQNSDTGPAIPPHYLMKVGQIRPTLKLKTLNVEYVSNLATEHPNVIRHTVVYDNPKDDKTKHIVLTAETADLQKFVIKLEKNTNAWADLDEMKSITPYK